MAGTVPTSFYVRDSVKVDYEQCLTVSRGSTEQMEYEILFPGCVLRSLSNSPPCLSVCLRLGLPPMSLLLSSLSLSLSLSLSVAPLILPLSFSNHLSHRLSCVDLFSTQLIKSHCPKCAELLPDATPPSLPQVAVCQRGGRHWLWGLHEG